MKKKMLVAAMSMATILGSVAVPVAQASTLKPGCHWVDQKAQIQSCQVWSKSMNKHVTVEFRQGNSHGTYLIDGARSNKKTSAWSHAHEGNIQGVDSRSTMIMPALPGGSWGSNWNKSPHGENYQYETFLNEELPAYASQNFGVQDKNNTVVGLSMGATVAANMAAHNGDYFDTAVLMSGYYHTNATAPLIEAVTQETGGASAKDMWGEYFSPQWIHNDPSFNVNNLRGKKIIISVGSGAPKPGEYVKQEDMVGAVGLEVASIVSSGFYALQAMAAGAQVEWQFTDGVHSWKNWSQAAARNSHVLQAEIPVEPPTNSDQAAHIADQFVAYSDVVPEEVKTAHIELSESMKQAPSEQSTQKEEKVDVNSLEKNPDSSTQDVAETTTESSSETQSPVTETVETSVSQTVPSEEPQPVVEDSHNEHPASWWSFKK